MAPWAPAAGFPTPAGDLLPRLVELFADFDIYQSWTDRQIPVVILQPR